MSPTLSLLYVFKLFDNSLLDFRYYSKSGHLFLEDIYIHLCTHPLIQRGVSLLLSVGISSWCWVFSDESNKIDSCSFGTEQINTYLLVSAIKKKQEVYGNLGAI